jgi:hypothetical protein
MPEPSTQIAQRNRAETRKSIKLDRSQYTSSTAAPPPPRSHSDDGGGRPIINRTYINVPPNKTTSAKPAFLGSQRTILFAWAIAIAFVCADEWKTYHVLPRPSRLWWTTLVYGILAIMSQVETLIPLVNALALGYSIVLVWQYFNKQGQFASE